MKKQITTALIASTILSSTLPMMSSTHHIAHAQESSDNQLNFLHTDGKQIKDGDQTFQIRGVNAGNAFATEGWLGGIGDSENTDYKNINNKYNDTLDGGAKKTHQVLDRYALNRWDDDDFQHVKDMGGNTIRLPINYINLTNYKKGMNPKDLKMRQEPFKAMDQFIDKANQHGLYVMIDMHGVPDSQNAQEHSGEAQEDSEVGKFWDNPDAQGKAKEIWYNIANHYKDNAGVIGYDLLNEPKAPEQHVDKQVKQFYKDALGSIRSTGDKHIAFLEAWHDDDLQDPSEFGKNHGDIVYEYHNYPYGDSAKSDKAIKEGFDKQIDVLKNYRDQYNVPTYLGEFNTHYAGDPGTDNPVQDPKADDLKHIVERLNDNGLSWTLWNYDIQDADNNHNTWGLMNFKGINVDPNSNDFGKKEQPQLNQEVFNTLKEANNNH